MPLLYREYGRISICEETIGSEMPGPNNHSSSTIVAYWPGSGDSINEIERRVGTIQYFLLHTVELAEQSTSSHETEKQLHLFCYVLWKQTHPNSRFFGQSAIVCSDLYEPLSACSFLPALRILGKCAHAKLPIDLGSHTETLFVACPIPLKYIF